MKTNTVAILAVVLATAITTTMDFTGLISFSAFPLIGITLLFWFIQKYSRKEMGLILGPGKYYIYAILYPTIVLGLAVSIAFLFGDFAPKPTMTKNEMINLIAGLVIGPLMVLLTEEGFFRGWLWAAFKKTDLSENKILFITALSFVIWHISAVTSNTEYGLPLYQVPVYLVNAFLLGLIWGTMRWASGSVIVASLCHALWNAFAYLLFGYGEKIGLLGIKNTLFFGPEVGFIGIALNGLFLLWLWRVSADDRNT